MRSAINVSQQIRRLEKAGERGRIPESLKAWTIYENHILSNVALTPFPVVTPFPFVKCPAPISPPP